MQCIAPPHHCRLFLATGPSMSVSYSLTFLLSLHQQRSRVTSITSLLSYFPSCKLGILTVCKLPVSLCGASWTSSYIPMWIIQCWLHSLFLPFSRKNVFFSSGYVCYFYQHGKITRAMFLLSLISKHRICFYVLTLATDTCKSSISFVLSVQAAKSQQFPQLYDCMNRLINH